VAYGFAEGKSIQSRVSASSDGGATFTIDNPISNARVAYFVNSGIRLATDQAGNVYSLFAAADPSLKELKTGQPQPVHYRLNMSSDGGATWKYTESTREGGLVVDDGLSLQFLASFGGVNVLKGNITAIAVDPLGTHIYAAYGKEDATGTDRIYLAEFHPDGSGSLVERANPVALSVAGQRSALPSLAVTASGTIAVQYDTFTPGDSQFHVHLATSTDQGQTFTDQDLYNFTTTGIPFPTTGGDRLLGDYQDLTALGNTVFGTFAARGNVNDPGTGINTTDKIDPFFYSVALPGGHLNSLAAGTTGAPSPAAAAAAASTILQGSASSTNLSASLSTPIVAQTSGLAGEMPRARPQLSGARSVSGVGAAARFVPTGLLTHGAANAIRLASMVRHQLALARRLPGLIG
jgi:hypothetical protein